MSVRLIIFDLDGTLVDSSRDLCNAINYAISPLEAPHITIEETKGLVGQGIKTLVDNLIREKSLNITSEDVLGRFIEYYNSHLLDFTQPYPNVKETLQMLSGINKAVVTNKREDMSRAILRGLGMEGFFDMIVGSDTTGEKKPSPVPLLYVMRHLDVSAENTLVVGDSSYDIQAGRAVGARIIAVSYGFRSIETLQDADHLVDSFKDILGIALG